MKTLGGAVLISFSCISTVILRISQMAFRTFDKTNYINMDPPYKNTGIAWIAIIFCFLLGLCLIISENKRILDLIKNIFKVKIGLYVLISSLMCFILGFFTVQIIIIIGLAGILLSLLIIAVSAILK
jgi:hypothetical protein